MTIPESAASRLLDAPRARASHPAIERVGRWVAAKGWIHVLLLTAVVGCLYPLVWMFMTSIKTDEELGQSQLAPAFPRFRARSPYLREAAPITRPADVAPSRFAAVLPALRLAAQAAVRSSMPADAPPSIDRA